MNKNEYTGFDIKPMTGTDLKQNFNVTMKKALATHV